MPFSVCARSLTVDVSDWSIFLLSMGISAMVDWQGCLLVFHKLDQVLKLINAATVTLLSRDWPISSKVTLLITYETMPEKKSAGKYDKYNLLLLCFSHLASF